MGARLDNYVAASTGDEKDAMLNGQDLEWCRATRLSEEWRRQSGIDFSHDAHCAQRNGQENQTCHGACSTTLRPRSSVRANSG